MVQYPTPFTTQFEKKNKLKNRCESRNETNYFPMAIVPIFVYFTMFESVLFTTLFVC